jgi:hypothetical protein
VRDWRLTAPHGAEAEIALNPAISLRPRFGVPLVIERRANVA